MKTIGIVLPILFFSQSLFADLTLNQIHRDSLPQPTVEHADCANFTGDWKGTCRSFQGKIENVTVGINQIGCNAIIYKDETNPSIVPIGAVKTSTIASAPSVGAATARSMVYTTETSWNAERDTLTAVTSASVKDLVVNAGSQGFNIREVTRLNGGKLYIDVFQHGSDGSMLKFCTLEK